MSGYNTEQARGGRAVCATQQRCLIITNGKQHECSQTLNGVIKKDEYLLVNDAMCSIAAAAAAESLRAEYGC